MKPKGHVIWAQVIQVEASLKYNINKKVKTNVNIHVSDNFDVLFLVLLMNE